MLVYPVQMQIRIGQDTADEIDLLVEAEAKETGHYVSRAVVCRKLIERGLRETKRKRKP